jgi:hypothetical protein
LLVPTVVCLLIGCDAAAVDAEQISALGDQASMFLQALLRELLAAFLF